MAEKPETCWEYWKCKGKLRENCPAFKTNSGEDCWTVADLSFESGCPRLKNKFKACWECPWFKKNNPDFDKPKADSSGI